MTETWRLEFKIEKDVTLQSMYAGGRYHFKGWSYLWLLAQSMVYALFAPLGAVFLVGIIGHIAGLIDLRDLPVYGLPAAIIFFVLFFLWLSQVTWQMLAQATADARFNANTVVEISAAGFTQMAPNSTWRTGWADVEAVERTKTSIVVYVSGLVQFVPLNAFASTDAAEAAFAAMLRWVEAAR